MASFAARKGKNMTEEFAKGLVDFFQNKIPNELIIFLVSLLPVLGNILPIPFILLFIRKIFQFLRDKPVFSKIIEKLEIRSMRNSEKIKRWRDWGLLLFVAIPLPGTGGWTGALIAALTDMRIKKSFPIIALGILIAGIIMSVITYLVPSFFGF